VTFTPMLIRCDVRHCVPPRELIMLRRTPIGGNAWRLLNVEIVGLNRRSEGREGCDELE
jgi:hypothetical protein